MSNGDGKESLRFSNEKQNQQVKRKSGSDEFGHAIARIAVAQICERLGFQSFQQSALDVFADVGVRYIKEVGKSASSCANLANRNQCNALDLIQGLEDLSSIQGFSGASDVRHSLTGSGVVSDIIRYVDRAEEIQFAYSIPSFPVKRKVNPSLERSEENIPCDDHIPCWLPNFPDSKTYLDLDKKDTENEEEDKIQQDEEKRTKVEKPLPNLKHDLISNGSGAEIKQGDVAKTVKTAEINPFLAAPLQFGEKEVAIPVLPDKLLGEVTGHHQIVPVETVSEPSIEASNSGPCETEDRRKIMFNGRQNIQFKFGNSKKSLNKGDEKISVWFSDDQDGQIDEKKRKTEQIIRENMENPQESSISSVN